MGRACFFSRVGWAKSLVRHDSDENIDRASDMLIEAYREMISQRLVDWSAVRAGLEIVLTDLRSHSPVLVRPEVEDLSQPFDDRRRVDR
jgi:hypothetical protein